MPAAVPAPTKPSDAPLPSCLDESLRDQIGADLKPRGVQKRNFTKAHKLVLVAHGGLYGGDLTSSTWIAGGSLGYFLTEDFGIQAQFDMTPLILDLDAPLNKFFGDNRFYPGMAYVALGNAMWSPIHAKAKLAGGIVHADIMFFAGGGRMFQDNVQGLSFDAGAALDLFITRVVTIRFDARDLTAMGDRRREPLHQQLRDDRGPRGVAAAMKTVVAAAIALSLVRVAHADPDDDTRPIDKEKVDKSDKPKAAPVDEDAPKPPTTTSMCIDQDIADRLAVKRKRRGAVRPPVREAAPPRDLARRRLPRRAICCPAPIS